ncbi:MAG TPA: bifunctional nicotinamidase/pyrazinamidase [Candidatus Sulfomarinibacteraceae bacterium]|nr:bifunctional nicotinamidase/pyrazinamidase [Candidatus Sulfomarinibacteraceae bacterium]
MSGRRALLVVDVQHDFLPGGALGVAGGDEILGAIAELVASRGFPVAIATQDWHPPGHASFASSHPGRSPLEEITLHGRPQTLWPDHCVQGSRGAELHPTLPQGPLAAILRKGIDPAVDSYSAFRHNWNAAGARPPTGLTGMLRDLGVEAVWLAGLARDFCVRWSAEDAVDAGFEVHVLWDLTRPVDPASDTEVRRTFVERGVIVE